MNLAIDIGNSSVKAAIFRDGELLELHRAASVESDFITSLLTTYPKIDKAIVASTGKGAELVEQLVKPRVKQYIDFNSSTPLPIQNNYATPSTLGDDRIAAAIGATALFPKENILIVDFGTAITLDVVNAKGVFLGGNISPGVNIRFKALNQFTSNLPLGELTDDVELVATSTLSAIQSGVINGVLYEIEGHIAKLTEKYDSLKIIFTGGDGEFFAKRLKNPIFVHYDLVVYGLNRILEHNAY